MKEELQNIILEPAIEFIKEFLRRWPQLSFIVAGIIIYFYFLRISIEGINIPLKYIIESILISIGIIWFFWHQYRYRFLRFTQRKFWDVIWNWHWKRDRYGQGTWTVSPIAPQCPNDLTRLEPVVKNNGRKYWECDKCGQIYGGKITDQEEIRKLKNLVIGIAAKKYGFRMGEAQETGKLKK